MKATFFLAAAALARVAYPSPIQYRDVDDIDDGDDDECGAPEPVTTAASTVESSTIVVVPVPTSSSASTLVTSILSTAASSPTSSEVAAAPSPSTVSSAAPAPTGKTGSGANPYTSNGLKAGLSGFVGIAENYQKGFNQLAEQMGWYSDYTATTPDSGNVVGIPMLWGDGKTCLSDTNNAQRLQAFKSNTSSYTPKIMMGFYEPDCDCPMSSSISDPTTGAQQWNQLIAPLAEQGTVLGSPSMCKQRAEDWLTPFLEAGATEWDVTNIHVNKNSLEGVKEDIEYYASTYGKKLWISELACVDDQNGFTPCSDQGEIDNFLQEVVPWLEANETVVAYGPSNGEGLGDVWPLFKHDSDGELSATGQTYLSVLQKLQV